MGTLLASQRAAAEVPALVQRTIAAIELDLSVLEHQVQHLPEAEGLRLAAFVDEVRIARKKLEGE